MPARTSQIRIAIVQDVLPFRGGAERVLEAILEVFPYAHIYTTIFNRKAFRDSDLARKPVVTSALDKLPFTNRFHRSFFPLYPLAFESFDLREYDLVLSLSYAAAHGVSVAPGQIHLCYKHTPLRQAWSQYHEFLERQPSWMRIFLRLFLHYFRIWDIQAASRVEAFASVSAHIARQIRSIYHRDARIIYPPVDLEFYRPLLGERSREYYLAVTRLEAHKNVEQIVQAFNRLKLPIYIIGEGREMRRLRAIASPNVQFLGYLSDSRVREFMWGAKGFVHAGNEDFGIAIVEAQAAGLPVIALGQGGATETLLPGVTGRLYPRPSSDALAEAILAFEHRSHEFNRDVIRQHASRFGKMRFQTEILEFVGFHTGLEWQELNLPKNFDLVETAGD